MEFRPLRALCAWCFRPLPAGSRRTGRRYCDRRCRADMANSRRHQARLNAALS